MKLSQIFAGCEISSFAEDIDIAGVTSDSRKVREGDLFICLRGTHRDGHDHAVDAVNNGAAVVLAEHHIDGVIDGKLLLTPDTRTTEAMIWYNLTERPTAGLLTIAVTGTAGKTSVAFLIAHIMRAAGYKVGMITTVRTLSGERELSLGEHGGSSVSDIAGAMTTPDPEYFFSAAAEMRKDGCDCLIYEASSQALLLHKLDPVVNDVAVFTNLSPEHLDCHGTMGNYFAAKASLMNRTKLAIVNTDDAWMAKLPELYPNVKCVRCSTDPSMAAKSDVCALRYMTHGADGIEYVYFSEKAVFRIRAPLFGHYSVSNSLEAAVCAVYLGVNPMTVKEALECFPGVDGRLSRIPLPDGSPNVFIDYAHTAAAIESVLRAMRETVGGKLIVLFGCGGDRDKSKRPMMAKAAQKYADFTIITSDNPRTEDPDAIIRDIMIGMDRTKPHIVIPDRREAIKFALTSFGAGNTIIIAGKGHEKYEIKSDGKHPFDEETIVREAVENRGFEGNFKKTENYENYQG